MIDSGHPVLVLALVCDQCGQRSPRQTYTEAWRTDAEAHLRDAVRAAGWMITSRQDLCPTCKPNISKMYADRMRRTGG